MTEMKSRMKNNTTLIGTLLSLSLLYCWAVFVVSAIEVTEFDHKHMMEISDVVVEGQIIGVTLVNRWIGNTPGVDVGYEMGEFEGWFLISKTLKGGYKVNQTLQYFVHAYKEGLWDSSPPRSFVYRETESLITPGTKLRLYLVWNPEIRKYERVHFNSGVVFIDSSEQKYPTEVGVPSLVPMK